MRIVAHFGYRPLLLASAQLCIVHYALCIVNIALSCRRQPDYALCIMHCALSHGSPMYSNISATSLGVNECLCERLYPDWASASASVLLSSIQYLSFRQACPGESVGLYISASSLRP